MYDILIVEDNEELRNILKEALLDRDYGVKDCGSAEEGMELIKENDFDIAITDLKLPEADGIELLKYAKKIKPQTEIIIVTAYGTVDKAVGAMKLGAVDFITKPFSIEHVRIQVEKILKNRKTREENIYLKSKIKGRIIGESSKIKSIIEFAGKIAQKDATVLITGESGTGKELVAEEIHSRSGRNESPIIKVNCAALAPGILESELFGHEKGAFTDALYTKKGRFELAHGGIIFLDEIGDLPLSLQVKLLRVIQEKTFERVGGEKTIKVDVRVIAATNKNLKEAVKQGIFREELYYRLNVVEINVPPLRERKEDIPLLVDYFISKYSEYNNYKIKGITKEALDVLSAYSYPGNVRELENIIQRIMVMCSGEMIDAEDIPYEVQANIPQSADKGTNLSSKVEVYEKDLILKALEETKGNKAKAAEVLKINRATLMAKIKKYGIG